MYAYTPIAFVELIWRMLPDRCEMPDCSRQGVRGNENVVDGKRVCDGCHSKMLLKTALVSRTVGRA